MKDKRYLKMLDYILINEGEYCNVEGDRGGNTAYGVTQLCYDKFRIDEDLEPRSVSEITGEEIECLYYQYYNESKANLIDDFGIACYVFDCCVNHGARRSAILLQRALKSIGVAITVDGVIGSVTVKLVNSDAIDKHLLMNALIDQRKKFYEKIVENDKSQRKFLDGWIARADRKFVDK